jgi:hypothetical protein
MICHVLGISKSSFYAWQRSETYVLKAEKSKKADEVKVIFEEHRKRYGARRIVADLQENGCKIGRYQVRSWMNHQSHNATHQRNKGHEKDNFH